MYQSLVVPLDGSALAEQALPLALTIAARAGTSLQLVHVHVPYALMYADSMAPFAEGADVRQQEQERAYLDAVARRLAPLSALPVKTVVLESPQVGEALQHHAASSGAGLMVMTTHGRGPLTRLWLGSVADEMVRRASTPLLLVRPRETPGEPTLRHFLIPLDGSPLAEQVLGPATTLGTLLQADYTLFRTVYPPAVISPDASICLAAGLPSLEELEADARAYLERVANDLRARGLSVQTHVMGGQQPALAILEVVQMRGIDLVAMSTHGRQGLPRLLLGSIADKVLRGTDTLMLVYRPAEK
jgi:nucleotide-binding universal stress UspA family protein